MLGRDDQDPLFLQFKEAQPSVLEPFLGRSEFANSGQRVVEGQRLTQAASDIMLGWIKVDAPDGVKRDFYVRQLWDAKTSALVDVMEPRTMTAYARACGTELARAHTRAGDGIAIASYLGQSDTLRPRDGTVRRDLRRPERARLRGAEERRRQRTGRCGVRVVEEDVRQAPSAGRPRQRRRLSEFGPAGDLAKVQPLLQRLHLLEKPKKRFGGRNVILVSSVLGAVALALAAVAVLRRRGPSSTVPSLTGTPPARSRPSWALRRSRRR